MGPQETRRQLREAAKTLLEIVAVAAIYFVVARASLTLASIHPSATPIWPPTGLALATVLLMGYRIAPAILAGAFLVNLVTAGTLATSAAIAVGNTLEALIGAYLIERWSGGRSTFATPLGVAKFTLIVLVPATMTSATVGVASLSAAGSAAWANFGAIWTTWWLGDVAGALIVTPLVVFWAREPVREARALAQSALIAVAAVVVGIIAFSPLPSARADQGPLAFLAVLPLMWAALRSGQRDTATVAFILAAFAVWGTRLQAGPFARPDINESFLLLLAFMISISVPSLALSADVAIRLSGDARERFLHAVSDELRHVAEPERIMARVAAALGPYLKASRAGYSEVDADGYIEARAQWHAEHLQDLTARFPLTAFGAVALDELMRGKTRVVADTETNPQNAEYFPLYRAIGARAHVTVPLVKAERLQAALHVFAERPRHWTPAEVALCEELAERTWAAVERARAEAGMTKEIAERRRHEERLRVTIAELDARNRELLEHARLLDLANVLVRNPHNEIRLWNEGARRLYGWTKEEAIGRAAHELLRTEFPGPRADIEDALNRDGTWDGELVRHTKDGQRIVVQIHWELQKDADGAPLAVVETSTDITERKRYEEHFQFVMRELSHRSKNLLAVIQSIARQIALKTDNFAQFEQAFTARIAALAETHNLLVDETWRGADLHRLVCAHLAPFVDTTEGRVDAAGPPLTLRPTAAEQIGLALHELAANAATHGALSTESGKVQVRWGFEPDGADAQQLRFTWREYDGPPVGGPARKGFGDLVMSRVVPLSLKGTASLAFEATGITWMLVAPASNVVAKE